MITRFNGFINESLLDKMKGKSKEDLWKSFDYDKSFNTPEEFFLDVIKGIKIKEHTKYPKSVFLGEKR